MDRTGTYHMMKSPSFRDQPRRNSTSQVNDGNPPPLPTRKLSELPPLNKQVTIGGPPPPPTRKAATLRPKASSPRDDVPALPVRDRSSWTPSNDPFEERYKFHKVSEFPPPEIVQFHKKSYPSTLIKKAHKKPPSPPPPPPNQGETLAATAPPLRSASPAPPLRSASPRSRRSESGDLPPPLPKRKSSTDHSIFSKDSAMKTKM